MSAPVLRSFGQGVWFVDHGAATVAGFRYPTRMMVIRLADGGLFLWSPVACGDALAAAVSGLGEVRHLVAPNSLHHLHLRDWQAAFPAARLYAAPGLRARRADLAFDADLSDEPPPDWAGQIDQVLVRGNRITTEVVFFHRASRTAIFTDLIQHFRPGWFTGWRAVVARADLMTGGEPAVPRKFRVAFTDRAAARAALRRVLAWPSEKLLMAHGPPIEQGGQAFIARAFAWLRV